MNELFDISKTNWLDLDADPAKTTNAGIEEEQKKNAQIWAINIAEAKRFEEQKSKQYLQAATIIGQGAKAVKGFQDWKDKSEELDATKDKMDDAPKEVDPEEPEDGKSEGDESKDGKPKGGTEKDDDDDETKIDAQANEQQRIRNAEANAKTNNAKGALSGKDYVNVMTPGPYEEIKKNWGTASLYFDENYHRYMRQRENDPALLEGHPVNTAPGSNGKWTIRQAEALGGPLGDKIADDLKWFYKKVFFQSPELKNLSNRHTNKLLRRMNRYDEKDRLAKNAALEAASHQLHKNNRIAGLETCINDGGGTSCLADPYSGHVAMNEGMIDGTKDNSQGWKIALEDLTYLKDNKRITPEQLRALATGKLSLRGTDGTEVYINEVSNLSKYENQILQLADDLENERFKEDNARRKSLTAAANTIAIGNLLEDKNNNVRIDNEYINNALTLMQKELEDKGIFVTKDELRAIDNSIDKFNTFEEVADEDITGYIDKLIKNDVAIPNADAMLVQIDDPAKFKEYTKKVDEHRVRLSLVDADDAKKFNSYVLPTINSYLKLTQATTLKTPEKRDLIDNALKIYKEKVAATHEDLGLDKAKILAREEIEKEIRAAAEKVEDLPGKYTESSITEIDVPQIKRIQSTRNYIENTPNAITDNKPWSIETPEVIQQRKDYLAGKAAPPLEYIVMSNEFPNHTYHSLMETREAIDPKDDKEGFDGNPVDSKEQQSNINNSNKLTDKSTPQRTLTALTSNDINKVLKIARKTDDVNKIQHFDDVRIWLDPSKPGPLERRGFGNRKLSELSVDEVIGLLSDNSFRGFSNSKFGLYGIKGSQLKTILERESIDGDRLFDEALQNELAIHNVRYKANQANSLAGPDITNSRLVNISKRERQEFLQIMGVLPGEGKFGKLSEEDQEAAKDTAEYQFLNDPWNDLSLLLPAVQETVIQKDPDPIAKRIYDAYGRKVKSRQEELLKGIEKTKQEMAEQEEMFPTK